MADPEPVKILRRGSEIWNMWRKEQSATFQIDLLDADLHDLDLRGADLSNSHMHGILLNGSNLEGANLSGANLDGIVLHAINLSHVDLSYANLVGADLSRSDLSNANLSQADLHGVYLSLTNLSGANLNGSNLRRATARDTVFARMDLRSSRGLAELYHQGPSRIELHTVQLPQDGSALHFLRGVGVPNEWIDDYRTRMMHPIQYHSCFISYTHQDNDFAHRLHADLQDHGVRCWFAPEDMKIGDKIRKRIDEAIHLHEKLLLLLSEQALTSDWVEDEVETALKKEHRQQREVLFPVRLDNTVMETSQAWAAKLRRQRHIGDFTKWKDQDSYQIAFDRLMRDLKKADE